MDTLYGLMGWPIFGIVIGAAVVLLAQRSIPGERNGLTRLHVGRHEPFIPPCLQSDDVIWARPPGQLPPTDQGEREHIDNR